MRLVNDNANVSTFSYTRRWCRYSALSCNCRSAELLSTFENLYSPENGRDNNVLKTVQ